MSQAKRTNRNADHSEAEEGEGATVVAAADTAEIDAEEAEVTEDVTDAAAVVDIETVTGTKASIKIS